MEDEVKGRERGQGQNLFNIFLEIIITRFKICDFYLVFRKVLGWGKDRAEAHIVTTKLPMRIDRAGTFGGVIVSGNRLTDRREKIAGNRQTYR